MITIYTSEQVAAMLGCTVGTVEEWARDGRLPGIKVGVSWVFPSGALAQRLDELATEQASARRNPPKPAAVVVEQVQQVQRGRKGRPLPALVSVG